jgi:D-glycero-alpha-D-manno-heptose-7-phosphate kinase
LLVELPNQRQSKGLIQKQQVLNRQNDGELLSRLLLQKSHGEEMVNAIRKENLVDVAKILNNSWNTKKSMIDGISNLAIDNICLELFDAGAIAVKLTGAGGGGHLIIITEPLSRPKVIRRVLDLNMKISEISMSQRGVELWTN